MPALPSPPIEPGSPALFWPGLAGLACCLAGIGLLGPVGAAPGLAAGLYLAAFACLLGVAGSCPAHLPPARVAALIAGLALGLKILYFLAYPADRDMARYIWDGLVQTVGVNPYAVAPNDPSLAWLRQARPDLYFIFPHPNLTAIYPPLSELLFRWTAALSPTAGAFAVLLTVFDLGCVGLLAAMTRRRGLPPARLALYALSPLIMVFVSGEGHLDSLPAFFLLASLAAFSRRREGLGFLMLGLGGMAKYPVLAAAPFFVTAANWRKLPLLALPGLLFLLYLDAGAGIFASLGVLATQLGTGAGLAGVVRAACGPAFVTVLGLMALAACAFIWLTEPDRERGAFLGLGATILLSPVLYPWYVVPLAALSPLHPSLAWLAFMAAQAGAFPAMAEGFSRGIFVEHHLATAAALAVFFAVALPCALSRRRLFPDRRYPPPGCLSVIVPARNEAGNIAACLDSIRRAAAKFPGPLQIILADGGSSDATREIAAASGAVVIEAAGGRGGQIAAAVGTATGDAVLVLHADCRLEEDALARLADALTSRPGAAGGALGMRFAKGFGMSGMVSGLNNIKTWITGISFGDQGQFFRRQALADLGGFPDMALMEDVELSLRLKALGETIYLGGGVAASSRAWERFGVIGNFKRILPLVAVFLIRRRLGLPLDPAWFYRKYYGQPG